MNLVKPVFTEYEREALHEIARHHLHPNTIQRLLGTMGKPVGRLLQIARETQNPALKGISQRVQGWIQEGLIRTVRVASRITGTKEVQRRIGKRGIHVADMQSMRYLPMSELDAVADSFSMGDKVLLGLEGALLGSATTLAEGVPGAQLVIPALLVADVTASMTLLSRQTCRLASVYGFPPNIPENLPHVVAAMAPQTETSDEGYLMIKGAVLGSIHEAGRFASRTAGVMIDRSLLEKESPQMIRLIAYVADRLGITVTQKELGILVPIAGAVLNSSINMAFQQVAHQTAKDYFRRLLLEDRYGEELVAVAIATEIDSLRPRLGA